LGAGLYRRAGSARKQKGRAGRPRFQLTIGAPIGYACRAGGEAMAERVLGVVKLGLLALALRAGAAVAAPVNSDLATAQLGGGCYPTGIHPAVLDMLVLVDPEWAP